MSRRGPRQDMRELVAEGVVHDGPGNRAVHDPGGETDLPADIRAATEAHPGPGVEDQRPAGDLELPAQFTEELVRGLAPRGVRSGYRGSRSGMSATT